VPDLCEMIAGLMPGFGEPRVDVRSFHACPRPCRRTDGRHRCGNAVASVLSAMDRA
jgi:hypothetical protein